MDIKDLLQKKRDEILRIAAKHGARNVRVFGSVVRGEADEESDIDLLVEMEPAGVCWTMRPFGLNYRRSSAERWTWSATAGSNLGFGNGSFERPCRYERLAGTTSGHVGSH